MTTKITSHERVAKSLAFQEPDRVPTAIGGGPYGIVDDVYLKLVKTLLLGKPTTPFRQGHNISYLDNRLFEKLGTDFRYVYPTVSPTSPIQATSDPDTFLDAFGQVWKRATPYYYSDKGILTEIHTIDQIDEIVNWPIPNDPLWFAGVRERAQELRESSDYWITARMITSHGPFQYASDLRGVENFMMDMIENHELAFALLNRIGDTLCELLKNYLLACGPFIDMIELPGDDYAGNTNLIISPAMFRKFIKPVIVRMVNTIRTYREDIKIMLHSDGAITKLIPDLIEIGIDVLHPLEPLPAVDQQGIKLQYGNKIAFLGGIDISHAMPGSIEDVKEEVTRCIQVLARGGGYVLAPSNHLQSDVPPENVVALFEYARKFGRYPIEM